nr:immunoglobulin light chain junction region [Macaca mulatta]MOV81246.1 immunoglobulin light chain junction region [Macaca mulatta]MOV82636.1 immunoglobulin light chain junction region [Macaca mulatta]MOV83382.1 immunoglobulin light chain junction region [Macaca mulatta]MOV83617.1 immunoglobulin light chain junction region [Macaca mulatta]
CLQGDTTPFTF